MGIAEIILGLVAAGTAVYGAYKQSKAVDDANKTNLGLANIARQDDLTAQVSTLGLQRQSLAEKKREFDLSYGLQSRKLNQDSLSAMAGGVMGYAAGNAQFQNYLKNLMKV